MIIEPGRSSDKSTPTPSPAPRARVPRPNPRPSTPGPSRNLDRLFLYQRGELTWDQMTGFRGGPQRHGHTLMLWSWLAIVIDSLVLISMSSIFVLVFKFITQSSSSELVRMIGGLGLAELLLGAFLAGAWFYMITTRVLFGFSIGEWACDLRLGQPSQRMRLGYPFRVIWRASLIFATGVVLLPVMSLLFGRDFAGRWSGLQLVSLK